MYKSKVLISFTLLLVLISMNTTTATNVSVVEIPGTYFTVSNGIISATIGNHSTNVGGLINVTDIDNTTVGFGGNRAYLNASPEGENGQAPNIFYEGTEGSGDVSGDLTAVFGNKHSSLSHIHDSECHISVKTPVFGQIDCTTNKGTGRSKMSYKIWKDSPYIDWFVHHAGTSLGDGHMDNQGLPFAARVTDQNGGTNNGDEYYSYTDARFVFENASGVYDIEYVDSGIEAHHYMNMGSQPWIVDYRTTSNYKGMTTLWNCDNFTTTQCGDMKYGFKTTGAGGDPYAWQAFPQNNTFDVGLGINTNFTRRYGLFHNNSISWSNIGIRESTIFHSVPSITNYVGICNKDYSGDTLKCDASKNTTLNSNVTINGNITQVYFTIEGLHPNASKIEIYNSTSGVPSAADLWVALSNESGTWVYVNQSNNVTANGCDINGTFINSDICNKVGITQDGLNTTIYTLFGSFNQTQNVIINLTKVHNSNQTKNIAINLTKTYDNSTIPTPTTTTTTTTTTTSTSTTTTTLYGGGGSSGGGGGGGGGSSGGGTSTTTTTIKNVTNDDDDEDDEEEDDENEDDVSERKKSSEIVEINEKIDELIKTIAEMKKSIKDEVKREVIEEMSSEVVDVYSEIDDFEEEISNRGLLYSIRKFLGFAAKEEMESAEFLENRGQKLKELSHNMTTELENLDDSKQKTSALQQSEILEEIANDILEDARKTRERSRGMFSFFFRLL